MNKKALVIEDDKNIAELLRLYLEKDGFEVIIAGDGGKGLQLATDEHPDVILLDIMLPVMDGWQVCREIRTSSDVPIIMLTAKGETYDKVKKDADKAVNAVFEALSRALANGEKVTISGFGTFEVRERAERQGINPRTQEPITIAASRSIVFKQGKALKDSL